ncbi:MAG: hypothetical protein ACRC1T_08980 [Clostridium chrysemydis]|uniref:hypothetical protein n=1 Tax=Clostridium chrysemydis TaxID=2665504 RepID=UPI003F39D338
MISKSIEKIILELVDLGYSEKKILNRLKEIKEDLITTDNQSFEDNKKYNVHINSLIFGGRFDIINPSKPLLGLIKNVKRIYGSECTYYILYRILTDCYFTNQIYEKTDLEKNNWLMYLIKEKCDLYAKDFINCNSGCEQPL